MAIPELTIGSTLEEFPGGTVNKIIRKVNQLEAQRLPRRGSAGGARPYYVAITKSFTGATWATDKKTNKEVKAYTFSGDSFSSAGSEMITVGLPVDKTVSAGKFRVALVLAGHLVTISCDEWTLPAGWVEEP